MRKTEAVKYGTSWVRHSGPWTIGSSWIPEQGWWEVFLERRKGGDAWAVKLLLDDAREARSVYNAVRSDMDVFVVLAELDMTEELKDLKKFIEGR